MSTAPSRRREVSWTWTWTWMDAAACAAAWARSCAWSNSDHPRTHLQVTPPPLGALSSRHLILTLPTPPTPTPRTFTYVTRDNDRASIRAPSQGSLAEKSSPAAFGQGYWSHSRCCPDVEKKSSSTQRHFLAVETPSMHCHASR